MSCEIIGWIGLHAGGTRIVVQEYNQGGHNYAQYPCHVTRPEPTSYTDSVGMSYRLIKKILPGLLCHQAVTPAAGLYKNTFFLQKCHNSSNYTVLRYQILLDSPDVISIHTCTQSMPSNIRLKTGWIRSSLCQCWQGPAINEFLSFKIIELLRNSLSKTLKNIKHKHHNKVVPT